MPRYGFKLMTEFHDPDSLIRQAVAAEEAGFEACTNWLLRSVHRLRREP